MKGLERDALDGAKVLVLEDDETSRGLLIMLLSGCGAEVRAAASGVEGFEEFTVFRPDVVVSDIHMSGGDGLSFIRRVRSLDADRGGLTPAIAVSGSLLADEVLGAGFHLHLTKPLEPSKLLGILCGFIKGSDESRATWTLARADEQLVLTWSGHITAADMRAATMALVEILEAGDPTEVVFDLRLVTGFNPSVGSVAEKTMWKVRRKLRRFTIRGGPSAIQGVAKTACMTLGIPCALS